MLPTLDLRRLAIRAPVGSGIAPPPPKPRTAPAVIVSRPPGPAIPDASSDLNQAVKSVVRGQPFDNAFLSTCGDPNETLVELCSASASIRRIFLWGRNPYPLQTALDDENRPAIQRQYPSWWSDKIEWLPEDFEAVPRVVDLFITDHTPWTCRFVQPRCCMLIGEAAKGKRDEDYRWTSGPGWLLGLRCRPRSRSAMNYRTIYSMNGGGENEDPFGWY
jgi:hypothetical protein